MALVAHTAVGLTVLQNGMHGLAGDELINAAVALQAVFKLHCRGRGRMAFVSGQTAADMAVCKGCSLSGTGHKGGSCAGQNDQAEIHVVLQTSVGICYALRSGYRNGSEFCAK